MPILMLPILSLSLSLSAASPPTPTFPAASRFNFRGSDCAYYVAGSGPPVVLLHGEYN